MKFTVDHQFNLSLSHLNASSYPQNETQEIRGGNARVPARGPFFTKFAAIWSSSIETILKLDTDAAILVLSNLQWPSVPV